ncbi:MAG: lipoyl synthase [Planctomycetota bacterium]
MPEWLRTQPPSGEALQLYNRTRGAVDAGALHTVCEEARCPNLSDCWGRGTATFMVAGQECTRGCRFCSVKTLKAPPPLEVEEPERLADAVERMKLDFVVITVVDRDDLPDGGAMHYRACVDAVHRRLPETGIELLGSDLRGDLDTLTQMLDGAPLSVFAHNVECVPRLDKQVRDPRASFDQSIAVLNRSRAVRPDLPTKSSIMVGLGETDAEVIEAMRRLRDAEVQIVTLGQYMAPGKPGERFLPVDRYVHPDIFADYAEAAYGMGFKGVASGPMVRSSFRAGVLFEAARTGRRADQLLGETHRREAGPRVDVPVEAVGKGFSGQ